MKTAVSIPDPVFRAADQMARRLNVSRSELYRRALVRMLEEEDDRSITARLDELYATEDNRLDAPIAAAQRQALGDWE